MKRVSPVVGVNSTFFGSPSTAAAMARQNATSKPSQLAAGVGRGEAGEAGVGAAFQRAARLDVVERRRGAGAGAERQRDRGAEEERLFHWSFSCWAASRRKRHGALRPPCLLQGACTGP